MATDSLSQRAYQHIQREIISGQLTPGSVVSETLLAKQLGISRTPVGEAIRQLAHEGLVEQVPRYGTIVCEIDQRKILELYELREALEPYAARQAALRMTASELAPVKPELSAPSLEISGMKARRRPDYGGHGGGDAASSLWVEVTPEVDKNRGRQRLPTLPKTVRFSLPIEIAGQQRAQVLGSALHA